VEELGEGFTNNPFTLTENAITALSNEFGAAMFAAHNQFVKFVGPAAAALQQKVRFDPRIKPTPYPSDSSASAKSIRAFFGCMPKDADANLVLEYAQYCDDWENDKFASHYTSPTGNMSRFWTDKAAGGRYASQLTALGMWHCEVLTSSVAAERAFGVMRDVEAPKRLSMTFENWQTEIMLRVNKWIVQSDFSAVLQRRERPAQAGTFFYAASSSSGASSGTGSSSSKEVLPSNDFSMYLHDDS